MALWWACQDLNLGPHPYQLNAGNRCAEGRFRRSPATVGAKVMRSNGAVVCVLPNAMRLSPTVAVLTIASGSTPGLLCTAAYLHVCSQPCDLDILDTTPT
jgi:hypothetical protein